MREVLACHLGCSFFFFFNDTATTEIYTLSLHDALPISDHHALHAAPVLRVHHLVDRIVDRKSTRLNSSHGSISYAVFCLKNKQTLQERHTLLRRGRNDRTLRAQPDY